MVSTRNKSHGTLRSAFYSARLHKGRGGRGHDKQGEKIARGHGRPGFQGRQLGKKNAGLSHQARIPGDLRPVRVRPAQGKARGPEQAHAPFPRDPPAPDSQGPDQDGRGTGRRREGPAEDRRPQERGHETGTGRSRAGKERRSGNQAEIRQKRIRIWRKGHGRRAEEAGRGQEAVGGKGESQHGGPGQEIGRIA